MKTLYYETRGDLSLFKNRSILISVLFSPTIILLKSILILFLLTLSQLALAQPGKDGDYTVTTQRTVINRYTRVSTDISIGSTTLTVNDITELAATGPGLGYINTSNYDDPLTFLNPDVLARTIGGGYASDPLAVGDLIMIYQAQGAIIDVTNTTNYGAVTSYNGAGQYEFFFVQGVSGNNITLSCATRENYFVSKYVQVVRIPQYKTLTVNAGASISATPWGSPTFLGADASADTRRRGGIVSLTALNVVNNGTIETNGSGFRGGVRDNFTSSANATIYSTYVTTDPALAGEKGESIAGFRVDYGPSTGSIVDIGVVSVTGSGVAGRYGRGAPANGGGGGNAHNAGGGGGANGNNLNTWFLGTGVMNDFTGTCGNPGAWTLDPDYIANGNALTNSSGGGRGGYTYGSSNVDACTIAPSSAGWGGDQRDPVGGFGGRPLDYSNNERLLYFGGGGGAGDGNNNASNDGGNGGGLVFMVVLNSLTGTGTISANGNDAPNTIAAGNDAPGGGGGGGTIVIKTKTISNSITLSANGGKGGNQIIATAESEGPGGGGGGGYIAIGPANNGTPGVSTNPTRTANGGVNGTTNSSSVTEFIANGATSGATGVANATISNYFIPYDITVCYYPDSDGDGITDEADIDDDNDGILDTAELGGTDYSKDTNGNGVPEYQDPTFAGWADVNFDGVLDITDKDGDGVPNQIDLDSDNDGIFDTREAKANSDSRTLDSDNNGRVDGVAGPNGWPDAVDNVEKTNTVLAVNNTDGDLVKDFLDLDSDNDGINDVLESGIANSDPDKNGLIGSGAIPAINTNGIIAGTTTGNVLDTDKDNVPDFRDLDADNDGITDVREYYASSVANPDINGDGIVGNAVTTDADADGILDVTVDAGINVDGNTSTFGDNGDYTPANTDGTGAGFNDNLPDYKDLDSDNDSVNDVVENNDSDGNTVINGSESNFDTDGNGLVDGTDTDSDGILSAADKLIGFGDNRVTLPVNTDGDAQPNFRDLYSTDATNAVSGKRDIVGLGGVIGIGGNPAIFDNDGNGMIDGGPDPDNDGISNLTDASGVSADFLPALFGDSPNNPNCASNTAKITLNAVSQTIALGASTDITATGGISYTWKTNVAIITNTGNTITVKPTVNTWFVVTALVSGGCQKTDSILITVTGGGSSANCITSPLTLGITPAKNVINLGENTTITASGGTNYTWKTNPAITNTSGNGSTITVQPLVDTWFIVTATNAGGCQKTDSVKITVVSDCEVYLPNLFSPNADGNNDSFKVRGNNVTEIDFKIFDRAGNLMYRTTDVNEAVNTGWNGRNNGSDQPIGMYIWTIEGKCFNGGEITFQGKKSGKVNLIR